MLGALFPKNCSVTAKSSLKKTPFLGWFMSLSGSVFIDRKNSKDAREAMAGAAKDMQARRQSVYMFPEGTRSYAKDPTLLPFKKGAFHLAVQAGVPIVPCVVANYSHILWSNSPELEGPGEANIHPLFRSDSPVPPPNVTPGTVVVASPNAGQVISDRKSARRMRSSSLANGQSPLSHQSSFEFLPSSSVNEQDEVEEQSEIESPSERKMTPPIPEWILTAGSRSSLTGYQSRKLRIDADPGC
ncbi:hypothetical protein BN1708_016888 [Verticillium longisporum]|uniref:Phospholipid/glycerol acyltransferase domain-containing protein n=1 Tax=Verticillium longisporum TaxID=100787 RepID=A0A0G4N5D9_VERLO|nr:hypothetical protein BN1708_016888 [Verticillium longisporum]